MDTNNPRSENVVTEKYKAKVYYGATIAEYASFEDLTNNRWEPFASEEEFILANLKMTAPIMPARLMDIFLDCIHNPEFDPSKVEAKNSKQLLTKLDSMVQMENVPIWEEAIIDVGLPGETWAEPQILRFTDPLEQAKRLFGRQDVHVQLVPTLEMEKHPDGHEHRVYSEAWTGDRWDEMHVSQVL